MNDGGPRTPFPTLSFTMGSRNVDADSRTNDTPGRRSARGLCSTYYVPSSTVGAQRQSVLLKGRRHTLRQQQDSCPPKGGGRAGPELGPPGHRGRPRPRAVRRPVLWGLVLARGTNSGLTLPAAENQLVAMRPHLPLSQSANAPAAVTPEPCSRADFPASPLSSCPRSGRVIGRPS